MHEIASGILGMDADKAPVRFVPSFDDLPSEIKADAEKRGYSPDQIEGAHLHGISYVVGKHLKNAANVAELLFHEFYTHHGLRVKFGNELGPKLDGLLRGLGGTAGVKRMAKEQGISLKAYDGVSNRALVEELLAHMSKFTGKPRRILEEYVGAVRDFLRRNGFAELAKYNASDLAHVLKQARQSARESAGMPKNKPLFKLKDESGYKTGGKPEQATEGGTQFKLKDEDHWRKASALYQTLAAQDGYARLPISKAKELPDIAHDISPDIKASDWREPRFDQQRAGIKAVSDVVTQDGRKAQIQFLGNGRIALDASMLREGSSQGFAVYHIAANFAHNNGMKFIGDPQGITHEAILRRTEHMLNSAMRFQTTKHLEPHPHQKNPEHPDSDAVGQGVEPLQWRDGDDDFNKASLLYTSSENVAKNAPWINDFRYNLDTGNLESSDGQRASLQHLGDIAAHPASGARSARAGRTTIARAILARSALQRVVSEGGRGERDGVLASPALVSRPDGLKGTDAERIGYKLKDKDNGSDEGRVPEPTGRAGQGATAAEAGRVPADARRAGAVRGSDGVLAESGRASGGDGVRQPDGSLGGLPRIRTPGGLRAGLFKPADRVAREYMASRGEEYSPPTDYARGLRDNDPAAVERATKIADAFAQMPHDPSDPNVQHAYQAMIRETLAQYEAMLKSGIKVEFYPKDEHGNIANPYPDTNPWHVYDDVVKNNHMYVYPTDAGFGSDHNFDPKDNPLLASTSYKDANGTPMLANDVFRAVHDYFGHIKEGVGFRADGEENAWRSHSAMYSPEARRAMTSETRGQNSWLNYGPKGEANRTAKTEDTAFADQKIGLLPDWVAQDGAGDAQFKLKDRSSTEMLDDPDAAKKKLGLQPGANTTRKIGEALNRFVEKTFGKIDPKDFSEDASKKISRAMVSEVAHGMASNEETGSGQGWYSHNYPDAVRKLSRIYPELAHDEGARSMFTAFIAITSNGEAVPRNVKMARQLYEAWRSGKPLMDNIPGTKRAGALADNVATLERLLEEHGGPIGVHKFLNEEVSVKDINAALRLRGEKPSSAYPADMTLPRAALYFGPKLGAFYSNLSGSHGYLTMDLWWSRMFNRIRGTLLPEPTQAGLSRLRSLLDMPHATDEQVIDAAAPYRDAYAKRGYKDGTELEKAANTVVKAARLELNEAPTSASERRFMYETTLRAQQALAKRGIHLSISDIQAALWYYEKRLYSSLGSKARGDIGYAEAISSEADEGDRPGRSIARVGGSDVRGPEPEGSRAEAARVRPADSGSEQASFKLKSPDDSGRDQAREEPRELSAWHEREPRPGAVTVRGVHYSNTAGLDALDGKRYGTNHAGAEFARLDNLTGEKRKTLTNRVYFYPDDAQLSQRGESMVGRAARYEQTLDNIYDARNDKSIQNRVDKGQPDGQFANDFEWAVHKAGYDGYRTDDMMVKLGGKPVPVKAVDDEPQFKLKDARTTDDAEREIVPMFKNGITVPAQANRAGNALRNAMTYLHDKVYGENKTQEIARNDFRAALAERDRQIGTADAAMKAFVDHYDRRGPEINNDPRKALEQAIRFENGQTHLIDPKERPFFATMRDMLDKQAEAIRSYGKGYLEHLVENYFPHLWEDPEGAASVMTQHLTRRPIGGNKKFTKERTFATLEEGLDAGLKPVTTNPAEMVMMRYQAGEKLLTQLKIMKGLEDRGLTKKIGNDERVPKGWAHVNDPAFGNTLVPDFVAKDLNNYLDPGLTRFAAWRSFRWLQNFLLSARLGLSAFHAGMTTLDSLATHVDIGLRRAFMLGDVRGAADQFGHALMAPVTSIREMFGKGAGSKLVRQFYGQDAADPHTAAILDMLTQGGARGFMSPTDFNDSYTKMKRAWKRGENGELAKQALPGIVEATTRFISHSLVPAQKMTARVMHTKFRLDSVADALGKQKGDYAGIIDALHPDTMREMSREINATIDDRLGQFAYDNEFWNKTLRDALHASVQSVGWNFGTLRLLLGGAKDVKGLVKPDEYVAPLDKAGELANYKKSRLSDRLSYLVTLNAVVAMAGMGLQYLLTGEGPKETKDFFFPRTGRKNNDGSDERLSFPSYVKDEFALATHPLITAQHKIHPIFSMAMEMAANRDFYGTQIFDPRADIPTEAKQLLTYLAKGFTPYAVSGAIKSHDTGKNALMTALPFVGVTPAPGDITKSKFNQFVNDTLHERQGTRSLADAERAHAYSAAIQGIKDHTNPDLSQFTPKQRASIEKSARTQMMTHLFDKLDKYPNGSLADQAHAYALATPEERREFGLQAIMHKNLGKRLSNVPQADRQSIIDEIRNADQTP